VKKSRNIENKEVEKIKKIAENTSVYVNLLIDG
jgi:hypothetical protein